MLQRFSDLPITCELMKPHRFAAVNVDEHVSEFFLNSDCSSTENLSCCCCCSVCCFSCLLQIRWLIKKPKPKPNTQWRPVIESQRIRKSSWIFRICFYIWQIGMSKKYSVTSHYILSIFGLASEIDREEVLSTNDWGNKLLLRNALPPHECTSVNSSYACLPACLPSGLPARLNLCWH